MWMIYYVPWNDRNLTKEDGSSTIGMCDNRKKCVFICENLSSERYKKVLCHEICHAYCFEYGIELSTYEEEVLCNFVSEHGKNIIYTVDRLFKIVGMIA